MITECFIIADMNVIVSHCPWCGAKKYEDAKPKGLQRLDAMEKRLDELEQRINYGDGDE